MIPIRALYCVLVVFDKRVSMKSAPRLYLLVLAGITILMIIENWVGDIDNRTRYNYKSEIQSRLSLHLRKVVASNIKVKRPFIQSSDHGIINSRPKSKKMLFTIENSDLSFPDSLPGWGKLPKIDDGDWKLSVNSRLKDGADSEYILNRRKQAQNECRPKNLGTDFYRIYEPIAMRYWDMMTEPSIKTAQRKFLDFRARRIIKRPPQGKGIVIVRLCNTK